MYMKSHRRISVIEIAVIAGALVVVIAVLMPAIATNGHHHHGGRQLKDAVQVRTIHQAMVIWAENHGNGPPEPQPSEPAAPAEQPPQ